jgi:hypothetical protein
MIAVLLTCGSGFAAPSAAQEQEPAAAPFACEAGAKDVSIIRNPPLRFVPREALPVGAQPVRAHTEHEYTFTRGPFGRVRIYLAAMVPEMPVERGVEARLVVYATTEPLSNAGAAKTQVWELVPAMAPKPSSDESTSHGLLFDARRIASCFRESEPRACAFADVSLATSDKDVPLIVLRFTRDGGGVFSNSTHAQLLLDFRESQPRVAVAADCVYSEAVGICAGADEGMRPTSELSCDWMPDVGTGDFLCLQQQDSHHRQFYLLSDRVPPPDASEVTSLEDAAKVLARGARGQTVQVARLGPVGWVDDIAIDTQRSVMLLASTGSFYLAMRSGETFGAIIGRRPHALLQNSPPPEPVGLPQGEWADERLPTFRTREIYRDRRLAVIQVAANASARGGAEALYWLGVGVDPHAPTMLFDTVRLAGGAGVYDQCGRVKQPASVVSIGRIAPPFDARVRVRPPVTESILEEDGDLQWQDTGQDTDTSEFIGECVRPGRVRWRNGQFESNVSDRACPAFEKPPNVDIQPDGHLRIVSH